MAKEYTDLGDGKIKIKETIVSEGEMDVMMMEAMLTSLRDSINTMVVEYNAKVDEAELLKGMGIPFKTFKKGKEVGE